MKIKKNIYNKTVEINNNIKHIYDGFSINENKYKEKSKSKKLTNDGVLNGQFPFFTSSNQQSLFDNEFMIDGDYLILGDGGDYPSLNYYNGKFSYSSHTLVLDYENNDNLYMYYYWLKNINELDRCFQGSKLKNIKRSLFINTKTILPSLKTQIKIAELLHKSKLNIKKIAELLRKVEIRNEYYSTKLLDGSLSIFNKSINKNNTILKEFSLDDIVLKKITSGATPKKITTEKSELTPINYYKVETLNNNLIKKYYITEKDNEAMKRSKLNEDDILITIAGSLGRIVIVNKEDLPANINQAIAVIRVDDFKCDKKYVYHFMKTIKDQIEKNKNDGAIQNLNLTTLSNLKIMLPDTISYQNEVSEFLDKLEDEKEKIEKLLKLEEQRFEWLSDKLLSGEYIIED